MGVVGYRVDPDGVAAFLTWASAAGSDINDVLNTVARALDLATQNSQSDIVNQALTEFVDHRKADVAFLTVRPVAMIDAVAVATVDIEEGDLTMAATAAHVASSSSAADLVEAAGALTPSTRVDQ